MHELGCVWSEGNKRCNVRERKRQRRSVRHVKKKKKRCESWAARASGLLFLIDIDIRSEGLIEKRRRDVVIE